MGLTTLTKNTEDKRTGVDRQWISPRYGGAGAKANSGWEKAGRGAGTGGEQRSAMDRAY